MDADLRSPGWNSGFGLIDLRQRAVVPTRLVWLAENLAGFETEEQMMGHGGSDNGKPSCFFPRAKCVEETSVTEEARRAAMLALSGLSLY